MATYRLQNGLLTRARENAKQGEGDTAQRTGHVPALDGAVQRGTDGTLRMAVIVPLREAHVQQYSAAG